MAKADVSIAAHYSPARVQYLALVLDGIAGWELPEVEVTLVTNDLALGDEPLVQQAREKLEARGFKLLLDQTHGLAHPWHLTWWHKQHLREWFDRDGSPEDLFMYVEDDIVVNNANLQYFRAALPALKPHGCLPGFLRYERAPDGTIMSPDYRGYQIVEEEDILTIDGQAYINPDFPYWAGFILDRELCAEYFDSPWCDLEKADAMPISHDQTCRVQSAWALTHWNEPEGMTSRYVVPMDQHLRTLEECRVWHSPNNYSISKTHNFGTVRMDEILQRPTPLARLRNPAWKAQALARRLAVRVRKELRSNG